MDETQKLLETQVRESNSMSLRSAIKSAKADLLAKIDFSHTADEYIIKSLQLMNREGNRLECELLIIFLKTDHKNGYAGLQELGIIVAPKDKLRVPTYIQNLAEFQKTEELAVRTWQFLTNKIPSTILAQGSLETNNQFKGLGLGKALLTEGEEVKDLIAQRLATALDKKSIQSIILDSNTNGWTSKHITQLPGYEFDQNGGPRPTYKKVQAV